MWSLALAPVLTLRLAVVLSMVTEWGEPESDVVHSDSEPTVEVSVTSVCCDVDSLSCMLPYFSRWRLYLSTLLSRCS